MPNKHTVILQPSGRRGQVEEGKSVREAARELGVEIESICAENATCGKCMVRILDGSVDSDSLGLLVQSAVADGYVTGKAV